MVIDGNDNVWIGGVGGLLKFDGQQFTLYNSQNTPMPLDYVENIAVDSKNTLWFASGNVSTGGIVKYDGKTWTVYTPENSILPYSLVSGLVTDRSDSVWVALSIRLVRISNGEWKLFSNEELGFTPYSISDIAINSKNQLVGVIDYFHSSMLFSSSNPSLFIFDGKHTTLRSCSDGGRYRMPELLVDSKDRVWCFGFISVCGVWIGGQWEKIDLFGDATVWAMKEDALHRIWFGTENGVYIRYE